MQYSYMGVLSGQLDVLVLGSHVPGPLLLLLRLGLKPGIDSTKLTLTLQRTHRPCVALVQIYPPAA